MKRPALIFCILFCLAYSVPAQGEKNDNPDGSRLPSHPAMEETHPEGDGFISVSLPSKQNLSVPGVYSLSVPSHPLLSAYLERYSSPEGLAWLSETMERGMPYRSFIMNAIEERSLPPELMYLPLVESEYRSKAVSVSGAVGLWQFMSNSISPSFMKINEWMDDRRDFWKATEAALDKLAFNYRVLGDWLLAIGAYNCGLTRMRSITEAAGTTDFWELADMGYLPGETKMYVPKFLAASGILTYPGRHGMDLNWAEGVIWDRIRLDFPVDLSLVAKEAGITLDLLKAGNSELNYTITPPETPYYLKVPRERAAVVAEVLSQDRLKFMKFYIHTVNPGDTLYDLGLHFGVGVDLILSYNPGTRPEALRLGTRLLVPAVKDVGPYPGRQVKAEQPLPNPTGVFRGTYTVMKGDTLWSISRKFETSVDQLAAENRIALNSVLSIGQTLSVPEKGGTP